MRYTSQSCSCSFSFNVTDPGLKVPETPVITAPVNGTILPSQILNQCGTAIWAFGDTLSAVNGIVTGANTDLFAACTHTCCFTRTQSCIQFNLATCPEVYSNSGVYYHRIRYVTSSFEVSEFSDVACFCIAQKVYEPNTCSLGFDQQTVTYTATGDGTTGVNQCTFIEFAEDENFANILTTNLATGSNVEQNSQLSIAANINPTANGEYCAAETYYTRITTFGGFSCQEVEVSPTVPIKIGGELLVFALCNGLGPSANFMGCNCIQLYATYTHDDLYRCLPTVGTSYKFEVSPFCDFTSNVTTACGHLNVFIPKCTLGGAGACPNYFVRTCLIDNTIAPTTVRCVRLGNVTSPSISGETDNVLTNGGRFCSSTINWTGPIAVYGIGSGGVGSTSNFCNHFPGTTGPDNNWVTNFWGMHGGASGFICATLLENPGGCLNCCTFCLRAAHANCGSFRSDNCRNGHPSVFCIENVINVVAIGASGNVGGLCSACAPQGVCCLPYCTFTVSGPFGASGNIRISNEVNTTFGFDRAIIHMQENICLSGGNTRIALEPGVADNGTCAYSIFCNLNIGRLGTGIGTGTCQQLNYATLDNIMDNHIIGGGQQTRVGLNSYGLGGPGALNRMCKATTDRGACILRNPMRGFGFGAGGASWIVTQNSCSNNVCQGSGVDGDRSVSCVTGVCAGFWTPQGTNRTWDIHGGAGGAGGMIFACNCFDRTHVGCHVWQGRVGLMVFACQDYQ